MGTSRIQTVGQPLPMEYQRISTRCSVLRHFPWQRLGHTNSQGENKCCGSIIITEKCSYQTRAQTSCGLLSLPLSLWDCHGKRPLYHLIPAENNAETWRPQRVVSKALARYEAQATSCITLACKWKSISMTENQHTIKNDKIKGCIPSQKRTDMTSCDFEEIAKFPRAKHDQTSLSLRQRKMKDDLKND